MSKAAGRSRASLNKVWGKVEPALEQVYDVVQGKRSALSKDSCATKMHWYTCVFTALNDDPGLSDVLHTQLKEWVEAELQKRVTSAVGQCCDRGDPDEVFKLVTESYRQFRIVLSFANVVFNYLDNFLAKKQGGMRTAVKDMFFESFHNAVYMRSRTALASVITRQVNSRRDGNHVDLNNVKHAVNIFIEVGTVSAKEQEDKTRIYRDHFESHYIEALKEAYGKRAAAEFGAEGGHYTYLKWVESRVQLEEMLAQELLRGDSLTKVREACTKVMLQDMANELVKHPDSGFAAVVEAGREEDIGRMYNLMAPVRGGEPVKLMAEALRLFALNEGSALTRAYNETVADSPLAIEKPLVESAIALHVRFEELLAKRCGKDLKLGEAVKAAFQDFLSKPLKRQQQRGDKTETKTMSFAKVLSLYCDAVMKREFKDIVDPDAELERLDRLVAIFAFVEEKDVFHDFYHNHLAQRLLHGANDDIEKAFLERLQQAMGKAYTHKMESMVHDRERTKALADEFMQSETASGNLPARFNCQVLTAAHWPSYKVDGLKPPASLAACRAAFERFYKKKQQTRQLQWVNMLGQGIATVQFPKQPKEVTGQTTQICVLLAVSDKGMATPKEMAEELGIDVEEVKPLVASMYLHKLFPILCRVDDKGEKQPTSKTIEPDQAFAFNRDFAHKMRKMKLPPPPSKTASGPTDEAIDDNRRFAVQACIVRVMKSHRTLVMHEIQDQTIEQLRRLFPPHPRLIKKCIEELVGKEYLARDDEDPKKFHYLA